MATVVQRRQTLKALSPAVIGTHKKIKCPTHISGPGSHHVTDSASTNSVSKTRRFPSTLSPLFLCIRRLPFKNQSQASPLCSLAFSYSESAKQSRLRVILKPPQQQLQWRYQQFLISTTFSDSPSLSSEIIALFAFLRWIGL